MKNILKKPIMLNLIIVPVLLPARVAETLNPWSGPLEKICWGNLSGSLFPVIKYTGP